MTANRAISVRLSTFFVVIRGSTHLSTVALILLRNLAKLLEQLYIWSGGTSPMSIVEFDAARNQMVDQQIAAKGVRDQLVLSAMRSVPREQFVPEDLRESAYEDAPLPIAAHQTISQPFIVAYMVAALKLQGDESVLEIGTGSGYEAAILGKIAREVFTIERIEKLAETSAAILQTLGYDNVHVIQGDGTLGLPKQSPFDGIIVSAGSPRIPVSLKSQLKIGGRMVIPVGSTLDNQQLFRLTRLSTGKFKTECLAGVRFVPLVGEEGWRGREHAATTDIFQRKRN